MENQHNILGSEDKKEGIEGLLRQAGKDRVIDAVVKGKEIPSIGNIVLRSIATVTHPSNIGSIAFSPNGKYIATACYDHRIRVFRFAGEEFKHLGNAETSIEHNGLYALDYRDDENHLFVATGDSICYGDYDAVMYTCNFTDRWISLSDPSTFSYNQNADCIIIGDEGGNLNFSKLIENEIRQIKSPIKISEKEITAAAFSPNGGLFAAADGAKTLRMYRFFNNINDERHVLDSIDVIHNEFETYGLAFSPDNTCLVMATEKGLMLWKNRKLSRLTSNEAHTVVFSPDGKYLAASFGNYFEDNPTGYMKLYRIVGK